MDRNYFIGTPEGGNSGGSKFDIMAFLPSLMGGGGKSLDPNLVAALMNNKGNQDAWGWWLLVDLDHPPVLRMGRLGWQRLRQQRG